MATSDQSKHPEQEAELRKYIDKLKAAPDAGSGKTPDTIGDFRIIRELGRGGMGTVYEAEQISLGRKVALKVLPAHLGFSSEAVEKFQREAKAGGRQSHPGIVAIHAVGEHEGVNYIAQELVEGGKTLSDSLDEIRTESGQPPGYFREAAALIVEVAKALQHAHQTGVIHRDIKPSNILLTAEGRSKVSDFGLAKVEDALALSRSGDFAGTPYYMSPEQAMSHRIGIDRRTDIYSLGVTLYEMLTLKLPFDGKTSQEVLKKIILVDPEDPHRVNPRVPRDLSVICLKAMEKPPEKRYQSMEEFGNDLERFLSGDVILAKPAGLRTRVWKKIKRNAVRSAAVGVAVLFVVAFVGYLLLWSYPEIKAERDRALAAEREASRQQRIADQRYKEIIRLADVKRLSDLEEDADELWPAYPENIAGLKEWLDRAAELTGRQDDHRAVLESLRQDALPYSSVAKIRDREGHPRWSELLETREAREKLSERIAAIEGSAAAPDPDELKEELAGLDEKITVLELMASQRRTYEFADTEDQWRHDTLAGLVRGIERLMDDEDGALKSVRERLAFAETVEEESIDRHQEAWDRAIASIADREECPQYGGLVIEPQIGLVPIGRDTDSGLWEFAHLQTGALPKRGEDGKLILTEEMGLVFVLIPGKTFSMGAVKPADDAPLGSPNVDPGAESDEGPVHTVTLDPFLISKYEMMQGQWERFTGNDPSSYGPHIYSPSWNREGEPGSLLHPVEQVSWVDCDRELGRLNLGLPTEAQWEYAARAGTATVWWTGDEVSSLQGTANLADAYAKSHDAPAEWGTFEESLDDGHTVHAPVGSFRANAFGLHDVAGNVWEWCRDWKGSYGLPVKAGDGERRVSGARYRVSRGGGFRYSSSSARSAYRYTPAPEYRSSFLGVRPARGITTQ